MFIIFLDWVINTWSFIILFSPLLSMLKIFWELNDENTWTHEGEQHTLGPIEVGDLGREHQEEELMDAGLHTWVMR